MHGAAAAVLGSPVNIVPHPAAFLAADFGGCQARMPRAPALRARFLKMPPS